MYVCVRAGWLEGTRLCQTWWGDVRSWLYGWNRQKTLLAPCLSLPLTKTWKNSRYSKESKHAQDRFSQLTLHRSAEIFYLRSTASRFSYFNGQLWLCCCFLCSFALLASLYPVALYIAITHTQCKTCQTQQTFTELAFHISCFEQCNFVEGNTITLCFLSSFPPDNWVFPCGGTLQKVNASEVLGNYPVFYCWPGKHYFLICLSLFLQLQVHIPCRRLLMKWMRRMSASVGWTSTPLRSWPVRVWTHRAETNMLANLEPSTSTGAR